MNIEHTWLVKLENAHRNAEPGILKFHGIREFKEKWLVSPESTIANSQNGSQLTKYLVATRP